MNVTSRLRLTNYGEHERYQQQRQPSSQWTTPRSYGYRHRSLTDADQTAWDSVSEERSKILDYNVKRATNNSNSNSKFRNNDKRYAKQRQDAESPPNGGLEAKVHDVHIFDKPVAPTSNNDYDLLNLATSNSGKFNQVQSNAHHGHACYQEGIVDT
jgi:hypothetical protein